MNHDPTQSIDDEPALSWRADDARDAGHPPDAPPRTWSAYAAERRAATSPRRRWAAVVLAAAAAGPTAVAGALLSPLAGGTSFLFIVSVVFLGPAAEEVLKAAAATYLAEKRPWLVPAAWTLVACTIASGLVFAAIENAMYLLVYIDDPSPEIVRFRWIAGPLLHASASAIAGIGIARSWRAGDHPTTVRQPPRSAPWLIAAIVLHGAYNATVTALSMLELGVPTG